MNYIKIAKSLRRSILEMIYNSKSGHIGGSFSCIDILVALFYGKILKFNSKKPDLKNRDRLIVSKGHASAAFYSVLSSLGFIKKQELKKYCKNNTRLATHLNKEVPGVEFDTGSLGHGLGVGCGLAYAAKLDKKKYNIFVLLSDGELYEGSTWEALIFANNFHLNNLTIIVDRNKQIVMDKTEDCMVLDPLVKKFKSFGFKTLETDGHSIKKLISIFKKIKNSKTKKPTVVIANTIKGKGVSFMEGNVKWHHSVPNKDEFIKAKIELR